MSRQEIVDRYGKWIAGILSGVIILGISFLARMCWNQDGRIKVQEQRIIVLEDSKAERLEIKTQHSADMVELRLHNKTDIIALRLECKKKMLETRKLHDEDKSSLWDAHTRQGVNINNIYQNVTSEINSLIKEVSANTAVREAMHK